MSLAELYTTPSILFFDEITYCLCTISLVILLWLWFTKMFCDCCVLNKSNGIETESASLPNNIGANKHRVQSTSPTSLSPRLFTPKSKSTDIHQSHHKEDSKYHSFDPKSHERTTEMTDTQICVQTSYIESPPTQSVEHVNNLHEIHIPEDNLSDIEEDGDIIIITTPEFQDEKEAAKEAAKEANLNDVISVNDPNQNTIRSVTEFEDEDNVNEHPENRMEIICHSENETNDHKNDNKTVCTLQVTDLSPPSPLNRSVSNESKTRRKESKDDSSHSQHTHSSHYDDYCDTRKSIHPIAKYLVTATIICALLFSITITWVITIHFLEMEMDTKLICAISTSGFSWLYLQRSFLYLYYIFRVYLTFKGSVYQLSLSNFKLLCIAVGVGQGISITFYIVWSCVMYNCETDKIIIALIPAAFMEFGLSSFCVWLFLSRLNKLSKKIAGLSDEAKNGETGKPEKNSVFYTKKRSKSKRKAIPEIQYLVNKLTVLTMITIASTALMSIVYIFTEALGILAIDTPINILCLMMSFGFYDNWYQRLCFCFVKNRAKL